LHICPHLFSPYISWSYGCFFFAIFTSLCHQRNPIIAHTDESLISPCLMS
jgi:hypothetical protein